MNDLPYDRLDHDEHMRQFERAVYQLGVYVWSNESRVTVDSNPKQRKASKRTKG